MSNNLMKWKKENFEKWFELTDMLEGASCIEKEIDMLQNVCESEMYDVAYLIIQQIDKRNISDKIKYQINSKIFQELWGDNFEKEYVKRYLEKVKEVYKNENEK